MEVRDSKALERAAVHAKLSRLKINDFVDEYNQELTRINQQKQLHRVETLYKRKSSDGLKEFWKTEQTFLDSIKRLRQQILPWIAEAARLAHEKGDATSGYAYLGLDPDMMAKLTNSLAYIEKHSSYIQAAFQNLYKKFTIDGTDSRELKSHCDFSHQRAAQVIAYLGTILPEYYAAIAVCSEFFHKTQFNALESNVVAAIKQFKYENSATPNEDAILEKLIVLGGNERSCPSLSSFFSNTFQRPMRYEMLLKDIMKTLARLADTKSSAKVLYEMLDAILQKIEPANQFLDLVQVFKEQLAKLDFLRQQSKRFNMNYDFPKYMTLEAKHRTGHFEKEIMQHNPAMTAAQAKDARRKYIEACDYLKENQQSVFYLTVNVKKLIRKAKHGAAIEKMKYQKQLQDGQVVPELYQEWLIDYHETMREVVWHLEKLDENVLGKHLNALLTVKGHKTEESHYYAAMAFLNDGLVHLSRVFLEAKPPQDPKVTAAIEVDGLPEQLYFAGLPDVQKLLANSTTMDFEKFVTTLPPCPQSKGDKLKEIGRRKRLLHAFKDSVQRAGSRKQPDKGKDAAVEGTAIDPIAKARRDARQLKQLRRFTMLELKAIGTAQPQADAMKQAVKRQTLAP